MGNLIYEPMPDEIKQRRETMDHLQRMGFSVKVVDSVMLHDVPPLRKVEAMIQRYGLNEARTRVEGWFE